MSADQGVTTEPDSNTGLKYFLARHPALTFFLMGFSFLLMGLISLNLIYLFSANFDYIREYGIMGLREGGLEQFIGLLLSGFAALALYIFFKACEKALVEWVLERRQRKRGVQAE
jgi:hypothetical protein